MLDGPVVVLVDPPPARFLVAAADRGVTAFATSSDQEELQGALEVGVRLHAQRAALGARVATLTRALDRRATIEQAKGVLDGAARDIRRRGARAVALARRARRGAVWPTSQGRSREGWGRRASRRMLPVGNIAP